MSDMRRAGKGIIAAPAVLRRLWEFNQDELPPDVLAMLPGMAGNRNLSQTIYSGSATYNVPGTYTFVVPYYNSLSVAVWGAGGSGAVGTQNISSTISDGVNGNAGGSSSFGSVVGGGGGGGVAGNISATGGQGGSGGTASGGTTNTNGNAGSTAQQDGTGINATTLGGAGGTAPSGGGGGAAGNGFAAGFDGRNGSGGAAGAPGGGGGGTYGLNWNGGGGGGSGALAQRTYAPGALAIGASVTVVVGFGGASVTPNFNSHASAPGGNGQVSISWS